MFAVHIWYPLLSTITNAAITALWIVSIYGQAGPDHSDKRFSSNTAWYISKSCSYAKPTHNEKYCQQAKGAFAVSVIMAVVFFLNLLLGIWSLIPTAAQRAAHKVEVDDMQMTKGSPTSDHSHNKEWELKPVPKPQAQVPYTPRTLAFNTLDRQLPLRVQEERATRWS